MFTVILLLSALVSLAAMFATYARQSAYRNGLLFAVALPKEAAQHDAILKICSQFNRSMRLFIAVFLVLVIPIVVLGSALQVVYLLIWICALVICSVIPFRRANRAVLALKREHRWTVEGGRNAQKDDDAYWSNGFTYHNPSDPRVFVEKRVGFGTTVNTGTSAGKWFAGIVIAILAAAVIGVSFLLIRSELVPPQLLINEQQQIEITYPMYSFQFAGEDMLEVTLVEELPKGRKTNGEATDKVARGHFNLNELGKSRVYIFKNNPPYIRIRLADSYVFYNDFDPEQTSNIFEQLLQLQRR